MRRLFLTVLLGAAITSVLGAQEHKMLTPEELDQYVKEGKYFLLDVREPDELEEYGTVKGYHHIPLGQLEQRLNEVPKTAQVVTMCERGRRAGRAADILEKNGYKVVAICGLVSYRDAGFETVQPSKN